VVGGGVFLSQGVVVFGLSHGGVVVSAQGAAVVEQGSFGGSAAGLPGFNLAETRRPKPWKSTQLTKLVNWQD